MCDLWTDLLGCLQSRTQDVSVFEGTNQQLNYHRLLGGQLLGQFIRAHSRCFGRGDVLTEDGSLVASYAQEALLRFRDAGDPADA
jgi:acyl-CoA thioesterase